MRIIKIEPVREQKLRLVVWMLGNTCPYKCSYCDPKFNDGTRAYHDVELVVEGMNKLPPSQIIFTGGEPSYHPQIEEILRRKPDHVIVSFISNGARPLDFWQRIMHRLYGLILTYHIEWTSHERFVSLARLAGKKLNRINLPMMKEQWSECVDAFNKLVAEGFPVSPKPILKDFGYQASTLIDYTEEQLSWLRQYSADNHDNLVAHLDDGSTFLTNPAKLLSDGHTNFRGFTCDTPKNFLLIDYSTGVLDSACAQQKIVGSLKNGFTVPTESVYCNQDFCWCHSDLNYRKSRV